MSYGSSEEVLRLSQNFMESRILLSGAELNLFTILNPAPLYAQEVAIRIGADLRALTVLLDALSAMGLLVKQRGTYQCANSVSPFLSEDAPNSILPCGLQRTGQSCRHRSHRAQTTPPETSPRPPKSPPHQPDPCFL